MTLTHEEELNAYQTGVKEAVLLMNKRYLSREEAMQYVRIADSDVTFAKLIALGLKKIQIPDSRKIAYDRNDIDEVLEGLKI